MKIKFKKLHPDAKMPQKAHNDDFYMPKLKEMIAEKNAKAESPINETISLKEIIPTKLE